MKNERIQIGILGCSDIARRRFLPALARAKNAALAAIASRDLGKAQRFLPGAIYDAVGYDDLLRHDGVDLVYLSLPNDLHEEWTLRALEQGKHVICEKPLGLSFRAVERVTSFARQQGLLVFENMAYLHHPRHALVRDLIAANRIGSVRMLRTAFGFTLTAQDDFRLKRERGGGALHDLARYPLSAARTFLRGSIASFRVRPVFRGGLNIAIDAEARTSDGERFVLSIGFDRPYACWYEVVGDRGKIRVDRAYSTPADHAAGVELVSGQEARTIPVASYDHFAGMIEHVCGLILGNRGYDRAFDDARALALLADELGRSCGPAESREGGDVGHDQVLELS